LDGSFSLTIGTKGIDRVLEDGLQEGGIGIETVITNVRLRSRYGCCGT
jgi:hypothetical protein